MKLFIESEKHAGTININDVVEEYPFLLEEFGFKLEQSSDFYIPGIKYLTRDIADSTPVSWVLNFIKEIGIKCECVVTLSDNPTERGMGLIEILDDYYTEWTEDCLD